MALAFSIGLFEMLFIAAILTIVAAPFVIAGVILWIVLAGKRSGRKD